MTIGKKGKNKAAFTLIETLVGTAVFLLIALSAYQAFLTLMNATLVSQAKIAATEVANERFEILRNLPYSDVGILGGLPVGKISRNVTVARDGFSFNVTTTIRSIDDTFDGTIGGTPNDTSPADYKLADLDINCTNCKNLAVLKFTTLLAPHALETGVTNGALFAQVIDASGLPVTGASLHIVNTQTTPDTIIDETTDNGGWVKIVDAVPGTNAYNITATKTGYSLDQTYPLGGAAGLSPVKPDSTVATGQVTQLSFAIDKLSTINATAVDGACAPLPNNGFFLTGTKLIGAPSVLKYPAHNFTTNGAGTVSIPNMEWDTYSTTLVSNLFDLAGTNPLPTFGLNPNEIKNLQMVVVPHVNMALLVAVKDSTNNYIDGATVRLQKTGFDETKTTGTHVCGTPGEVFWNGLPSGTYTMTISRAGYTSSITSVNVNIAWQVKTITLVP